jgi:hypothetical protein
MNHNQQVKVIGSNGQLSLGKEFAGQMVLVDQLGDGTWIIKAGAFIPDSEMWLHRGEAALKLDKALAWAEANKPKDNFAEIIEKIDHV